MARYLAPNYDPLPNQLLWSGADLIDVSRRIARNQNWIWANHGNVVAAFGREPESVAGPPAIAVAGALDVAYFACPNRTATGSDSVRVCGYWSTTGPSVLLGRLRLFQLLPGENTPTSDSPFDDTTITVGGTDVFFDFTARIRSGADPLRFCLRLIGDGTATYTLLTVTVTWARNPSSVLGETVAPWAAISQGFVAANRPMSAALLRAISNRTLRLIAENPRPIYSHSFIWPRIRSDILNGPTRVALYSLKHDELTTAFLDTALRVLVTGQTVTVAVTIKVNGATFFAYSTTGGTLTDGVYITERASTVGTPTSVPTGDLKVEVFFEVTVASLIAPQYTVGMGCALVHFSMFQATRTAAQLGLPGADTVPAAYQPLDESACVPGRSVVAQNDRLGRRAGPYYLVKNLIWLAANRTQHVLVADWLHRTEVAGYNATNDAGDGYLRNGTVFSPYGGAANDKYDRAPGARDVIGWADRSAPTNSNKISAGGQHYVGDVLGRFYCAPMNGGQIAAILRPGIAYPPNAPGISDEADVEFYVGSTRDARVPASRKGTAGGFRVVAPGGVRPSAGAILSLRGNGGLPTGSTPAEKIGVGYLLQRMAGMQAAVHSAYIFESPLTQTDLDALA